MAKTFKDVIVECEMYPHSAENYGILKECSELALMEHYIADQLFMQESVAVLTESGVTVDEGFFTESADSSTIDALYEKVGEKAKGLFGKIKNGFLNLLKKFIAFFTKLGNQLDGVTRDGESTLKALRKITLTSENVKSIVENGNKFIGRNEGENAVSIAKNQPFRNSLKLKYNEGATKVPEYNTFEYYMCIAFSNTTVRLAPSEAGGTNGSVGAIDINSLIKACKGLLSGKKHDIDSINTLIDGAWAGVKANGIEVVANSGKIAKLVETLKGIQQQIEQMQASAEEAESENPDSSVLSGMNAAYGKLNTCIGATIRTYTQYINFRKRMITAVSGFVTSNKNADTPNGGTVQ